MIDTGLAVITYKPGGCRMDIDAEDQVFHVKVCMLLFSSYYLSLKSFHVSEISVLVSVH